MKILQITLMLVFTCYSASARSVVEEEVKGKKALLEKVKKYSQLGISEEDRAITSKDWPVAIMINRGNRLISVVIRLDDTRNEGFKGHNYSYRSEKPKTDLPRKLFVPDDKRPKILAWMKSKGYKSEIAYWQIKENGKIEAYYTFFSAYIKGDNASSEVSDVIEYLIDKVFESKGDTFKMTTYKRG